VSVSGALKRAVARGAALLGLEIMRVHSLNHHAGRRIRLLRSLDVDLVVDVGANAGQYARGLRTLGYTGQIISVEALAGPYEALVTAARGDAKWRVVHSAAGGSDQEAEMFVAANGGASSSLLSMLPLHEENAPEARIVSREVVHVRRLDDLLGVEIRDAARPFLKIDVQGYESQVLDGAASALSAIVGLQVELSLFPVYRGAPTLRQMLDRLEGDGFVVAGLEPVFTAEDGRVLQIDGIFVRDPHGVIASSTGPPSSSIEGAMSDAEKSARTVFARNP
jgi:FkbM family methyltransferase